jgi:hypothetical protein
MRALRIFGVVIIATLIFAGMVFAEEDYIVLWGKQTEGWGATNAKTDGNEITLEGTATIVKVEGDAKGYCIWSGGKSVLCGGSAKNESIVNKTLPAGTYRVLPGLYGQSKATVTIYLQYNNKLLSPL